MMANDIKDKIDRFLDGGILFYLYRSFWDDQYLLRDIEMAGYASQMLAIQDELKNPELRPNDDTGNVEYNDLVKELNSMADNLQLVTEAGWKSLATKINAYKLKNKQGADHENNFDRLFNNLTDYMYGKAQREKYKHLDTITSEQLVSQIINKMKQRITTYNNSSTATNEKKRIMCGIQFYLDTGMTHELTEAILQHDRDWLTRLRRWLASFVYTTDEVYKLPESVKMLQKSRFFQEALKKLAEEKLRGGATPEPDLGSADEEQDLNIVYKYDSTVRDFKTSRTQIQRLWEAHRVTKQAFLNTLDKMTEALDVFQRKFGVQLPNAIPFPVGIVEERERVNIYQATVIDHIGYCIKSLKEKLNNDKMQSHCQSDCALLRSAINEILSYAFIDERAQRMISTEQRGFYTQIGVELTDILERTEKQLLEKKELQRSVKDVKREIMRLTQFHNEIYKKLTQFKDRLKAIHQGDFFNDIQDFMEGDPEHGLMGSLRRRQKELHSLLDSLSDCSEEPFNVLARDQLTEQQRKVCKVVRELQNHATNLTDELVSILLLKQNKQDNGQLHTIEEPRVYHSVGDLKADGAYSEKFSAIMEEIKPYAENLSAEESSLLADFFGVQEDDEAKTDLVESDNFRGIPGYQSLVNKSKVTPTAVMEHENSGAYPVSTRHALKLKSSNVSPTSSEDETDEATNLLLRDGNKAHGLAQKGSHGIFNKPISAELDELDELEEDVNKPKSRRPGFRNSSDKS